MKNIICLVGKENKFQSLSERFELFYNRNIKSNKALWLYIPNAMQSNDVISQYNRKYADLIAYTNFHTSSENAVRISYYSENSNSSIPVIANAIGEKYKKLNCIPKNTAITVNTDNPAMLCNKQYISVNFHVRKNEDGWLYNDYIMNQIAKALLDGIGNNLDKLNMPTFLPDSNLQASDFNDDNINNIELIAPLIQSLQRDTGLLSSVTLSQFILESNYGKSELFKKTNNCFGMKSNLSANLWYGSVWNNLDVYNHISGEYLQGKGYIRMESSFRKYESIAHCILDYTSYLLNAGITGKKRFEGIEDSSMDYIEKCRIISNGQYATDPSYSNKLIDIIKKNKLTQYDQV